MKKLILLAASIIIGGALYLSAHNPYDEPNLFSTGSGTGTYGVTISNIGVMESHTSGGFNLGSALHKIGDINMSGTLTTSGVFNTDDVIITLTNTSADYPIAVNGSFIVLSANQAIAVSTQIAAGTALFSTATANAGDYLTVTSTATNVIVIPVGVTHYVAGSSSPTQINTNDVLSYIFDGNYWVQVSSSVND